MNILRNLAIPFFLLSPAAANADLITGLCNGDTSEQSVICDTATELEWLGLDLLIDGNAQWFYGWEVALLAGDGWRVPNTDDLGSIFCQVDPARCESDYSVLDFEQEMQTAAESSSIEKCYPLDSPECQVTQLLVRGELIVGVPEPGTLSLFGIGLAGLGLARRRRKPNLYQKRLR